MANLSSYGEASDISVPAYQRGFRTLEKETSVAALNVESRIPDWLTGTQLRMGPARFEWGPDRYRHWFDGSGMIHKFSFAAGKVGLPEPLCARHRFCRKRARWRDRPVPGAIPEKFRPLPRDGQRERERRHRR
jgi:carotenoid cleavage dioxygenase-like enzyme